MPKLLPLHSLHSPQSIPNKGVRPKNLNLKEDISSVSSDELTILPQTSPKTKSFLSQFSLNELEKKLLHSEDRIEKGQNGIVNVVSLFFPEKNETLKLVKKQGRSSVQREITITNAISANTAKNFPHHLFVLPICQQLSKTKNTFFTNYRELGDLKTNRGYIQQKIRLEDDSALDYLFHIFHQLIIALEALHNSKFRDDQKNIQTGIVHNDIKLDNIFIEKSGDVRIADFGCAYFKNSVAPQFSTYLFSAPEVWENINFCTAPIKNIDRSDIWSVGASLMYLLTNELMAPRLEKPDEMLTALNYKNWAMTYTQHWKTCLAKSNLIEKNCNSEQDMVTSLKEKFKHNPSSFNDKKCQLEALALLMQAPIEVRPNAKDLKSVMDPSGFIFDSEYQNFVQQLLDHKNNTNTMRSPPKNGYISIPGSNVKAPAHFKI